MIDFKALFGSLSWFGRKPATNVKYVWVVVRLPLTEDEVRAIARHWIAVDAQQVLANPAAVAAMKSDLHLTDEGLKGFVHACEFQVFRHFPLIGFVADAAAVEALRTLPCVRFAHAVPDEYATFYLSVIKGLHYVIEDAPDKPKMDVVNLSLQPLDPYPYQPLEAMNIATETVTARGKTIVFAAGNFGDRGDASMNPWALAPWVISVGAADDTGTKLWSGSSRGLPGDPDNRPTLVAPGINVPAPRVPTEPIDPGMDNPNYVRVTGTSFSAACVSGLCAQIHEFIKDRLAKSPEIEKWRAQAAQQFNLDVWPIAPEPATVKRMLIDMARPVPGYGLHQVGAGFVSNDIAQAYYRHFRFSSFLKVFGKQRTSAV